MAQKKPKRNRGAWISQGKHDPWGRDQLPSSFVSKRGGSCRVSGGAQLGWQICTEGEREACSIRVALPDQF